MAGLNFLALCQMITPPPSDCARERANMPQLSNPIRMIAGGGMTPCPVLKRQVCGRKASRDSALSEANFWLCQFGCPERGCKKIKVP